MENNTAITNPDLHSNTREWLKKYKILLNLSDLCGVLCGKELPDYEMLQMSIGGVAMCGISSDIPNILWVGLGKRAYLIPSSITCAASCLKLSKSQRAKYCIHNGIANGRKLQALVSKDENDYFVKGFMQDSFVNDLPDDCGRYFKAHCVFSDGIPQICYSYEFGVLDWNGKVNGPTPIPNVPYDVLIDTALDLKTPDRKVINPEEPIYISFKLIKIVRVSPFGDSMTFHAVTTSPWNKLRIQSREIVLPEIQYERDNAPLETEKNFDDEQKPVKQPRIIGPRRIRDSIDYLWCFEDNRVICGNNPKLLVKLTMGTERLAPDYNKKCTSGNHGHEKRYPILKAGQYFYGKLIYNEFIGVGGAYHVESYTAGSEAYNLEANQYLENGCFGFEYKVRIHQSGNFKGFFVAPKLICVLIADPKHVLRNVDWERHREKGCSVWIRMEKGHDRLAHFSISALDIKCDEYTKEEKMMNYPNITGVGILVDLATGAVFSHDHQQTAIRLTKADLGRVYMGSFFNFTAAYWPDKNLYLVVNIEPISSKNPITTYYHQRHGRLILNNEFVCTTIQNEEMHLSWEFGALTDPLNLITKLAKAQKKEKPEKVDAYVCYNPDWMPTRDTQLMLYSLDLEPEAVEVTSRGYSSEGQWWEHCNWDQQRDDCRCTRMHNLLYDIHRMAKADMHDEDQIVEPTVEGKCQNKMKDGTQGILVQ